MELDLKVGIVSSVDESKSMVRVYFPDMDNLVSDWLFVLQHGGETEEADGKTGKAGKHNHTIEAHSHTATASETTVTVQNAGAHTHTITDPEATTESAGDHTHTTDAHTHTITVNEASPTAQENGEHQHDMPKHKHKLGKWLPKVNDKVLCLMFGGDEESDGFVLGAIE